MGRKRTSYMGRKRKQRANPLADAAQPADAAPEDPNLCAKCLRRDPTSTRPAKHFGRHCKKADVFRAVFQGRKRKRAARPGEGGARAKARGTAPRRESTRTPAGPRITEHAPEPEWPGRSHRRDKTQAWDTSLRPNAKELRLHVRTALQKRQAVLKLATARPAEGAPGPTWWTEWDYSQTHLRIDGA